jgi:hypothetical protein
MMNIYYLILSELRLMGIILISFFVISVINFIRYQIYLKKLKKHVEESGLDFVINRKNSFFKNQFNKFQTIQQGSINRYIINGIIQGNYFEYREIFSWFKNYSIITIDADTYKPSFSQILIKRQKGLKKQKDFDLEWNDFNTTFDNRFKNPRQALEIVTPTFMEKLFDLSKYYNELKFEYFETSEYQKHTFAVIFRPVIFSGKKGKIENEIIRLKKSVEILLVLKESV